jgi:hypothetical protein
LLSDVSSSSSSSLSSSTAWVIFSSMKWCEHLIRDMKVTEGVALFLIKWRYWEVLLRLILFAEEGTVGSNLCVEQAVLQVVFNFIIKTFLLSHHEPQFHLNFLFLLLY